MGDPGDQENGKERGWRKPLRSFVAWVENDDILTGFSKEESSAPEIRTFFVSTIGAALVAWDVAFNFGAFHTVFFVRRHQVAVVLFVVVLETIVLRRQAKLNWWLIGIGGSPSSSLAWTRTAPSPLATPTATSTTSMKRSSKKWRRHDDNNRETHHDPGAGWV